MKEGDNIFFKNDIKRIGFVSKVIDNDEYEVTYIIGVGPSKILKTIIAKRDQILNLYLKYNVNIHDTEEKIISVLNRVPDEQPFLTSSESHDDMYKTHIKALTRHDNAFRMVDGGSTHHRRSRRRKSRHHKKTNRRRKSNRRKRSKLNIKSKH